MPNSELIAKAEAYLVQCGSCDAGLPMSCICPTGDPRAIIAALLDAVKEEYPRGRQHAAKDIDRMSSYLGDEGWSALADQAEEAGYDRRVVLRRRRPEDNFTALTIEAAYQYGYRNAAKVALGTRSDQAPLDCRPKPSGGEDR